MSDTSLSDLVAASSPGVSDTLYVVSGGASAKVTVANLITGASITTATNTQTLTNKTITSPSIGGTVSGGAVYTSPVLTTPQINDTSANHQYVFAVNELTADRTVTLPLLTGNDEFVFKDFTQTLTNKTLTAPVFATSADLNGVELIIDADADSSLTADTDDRFDFKLGGSDRFRMGTSDFDIVTATGNVTVAGADPKRGLYVPASAMFGATTSGAATGQYESSSNKVNVKVLDFDTSADEYGCFNIPAPDYWDLSTITAQFHWTSAGGTPDQTVTWAIQALARSNDDALDTAYGTAITVADTLIATNDEHITAATSAVTVGGTPAKGDMLYFRIYRDVSDDNVSDDARLLGVRIKFGISQFNDA
jgi:hypothetical protein